MVSMLNYLSCRQWAIVSIIIIIYLISLIVEFLLVQLMKITLFCLPFAGGSKYSLYFLKKVLPHNISCHFLEYPGRGTRIKEDFAEGISELVDDAYIQIAPLLEKPYAIYGHSMGAKAAYLLAQRIREEGK